MRLDRQQAIWGSGGTQLSGVYCVARSPIFQEELRELGRRSRPNSSEHILGPQSADRPRSSWVISVAPDRSSVVVQVPPPSSHL